MASSMAIRALSSWCLFSLPKANTLTALGKQLPSPTTLTGRILSKSTSVGSICNASLSTTSPFSTIVMVEFISIS